MVEICDYGELLALHRALLELRWISEPRDTAVIGSRFIADIANRVVDELISIEKKRHGNQRSAAWQEWRTLNSSRAEWQAIQKQIRNVANWLELSDEQKQELVKNIASPFVLTNGQIEELVSSSDDGLADDTK